MKPFLILGAVFAAAIFVTTPTYAMDDMKMPAEKPAATHEISGTGTVVSANASTGSVTLKHEPIPAINWPKMTMAFKVKNKTQLEKLKKGDRVEFQLEKSGQEYVISNIQEK